MKFQYYDLHQCEKGERIQVTLRGNAANVRLMDSSNFSSYRQGRSHRYIGGLATHTCGMLKIGMALCDIYPSINKDYLLAGIILHDLGKIEELSSPVVTEYTTAGKLLGHISIVDARLLDVGKQLKLEDSEELMILRHMVLSHHGKYEFGSPILPETLEAEILTYIDNIHAKINIINKAFEEIKEGEFTQKIFAMDNRVFYKHK